MNEKQPFEQGRFRAAAEEKPLNPKWELTKFLLVLGLLTSIAVGNIFVRQLPLIKLRTYDFQSPFVFRNIWHQGEMAFKACFQQKLMGYYGYYVCHKFPPSKKPMLQDGEYSAEEFQTLFIDPAYVVQFVDKFKAKEAETQEGFLGFRIEHTREDLKVTPLFAKGFARQQDYTSLGQSSR